VNCEKLCGTVRGRMQNGVGTVQVLRTFSGIVRDCVELRAEV